MKKFKTFFLLIFTLLFSLTSCGKNQSNDIGLKEEGKLFVATNAEFPPFEYLDGTEFKGIDMDIINEYGKFIDVEVEIKNMDFDASLLSVSTQKVDLAIAAITKNAKREETLSFSNSYYTANQVIVVNEDSVYAGITNKEDVLSLLSQNKAKIGCQRGTTGQYYIEGNADWDFEGIKNSECKTYDNGALAITDLKKGNIDAVIIDEAPAQLYCVKMDNIKYLDIVLTQEEYCIAVAKGNEKLLSSLNEFIDKIKNDGTFDSIINTYFGDEGIKVETSNTKQMVLNVFKGLGVTFLITIVSFILGILLGVLVGIVDGIKSKNIFVKVIQKICQIYVSIFRGTPITVQLLIIYYVVFSSIQPLVAAIVAFGLNSGAYVSEIIRGGINSIPKGQMEAGRSLGLSYPTVMRKIILPQAIKNSLPSLGNEFIALIKETSVVSFITVIDLYSAFRAIATASFDYKGIYLLMGVVYFVIVFGISIILKQIEKKVFNNVKIK